MKRILSLLAVLCMMLTLLPIGNVAAQTSATLLFDMSLSGSTIGGELVVSDESGANASKSINTLGHPSSATANDGTAPVYKEEDGISYLEFASYDKTAGTLSNRRSQVNVEFESGLSTKEGITFEIWARPDMSYSPTTSDWGGLVNVGPSYVAGSIREKISCRFLYKDKAIRFYPDRIAGTNSNDGVQGTIYGNFETKWTHFVITRTLNDDKTSSVVTVYMDGKKLGEQTLTLKKAIEEGNDTWLAIGGVTGNQSAYSFVGDIADFKLYDGAFTGDEALAAYKATKTTYYLDMVENLKVFDMKIDGDESGNPVVTDESGANLVESIGTEGRGAVGSTDNALTYNQAEGVKYLTFASYDGSKAINRGSGVNVMFKDTATDLSSFDEITFEAWARPKNTDKAWGVMAALGHSLDSTAGIVQKVQFRLKQSAAIDPQFYPDKTNNSYIDYEPINTPKVGEWCHFVVTRKYDTTKAKWVSELYINGALIACTSGSDAVSKNTDSTKYRVLTIGNINTTVSGVDRAFMGDIADFKVYTKALTASEALAKYNTEKKLYYGTDVSVVWKNASDEVIETGSVDGLSSVKATITVENYGGEDTDYIFLLGYDASGNLVDFTQAEIDISDGKIIANAELDLLNTGITEVKVFAWDNGLSPLCAPQCL